jgi:metal-dependent amidase/aminoacylase/carboxypeptidase family protein
MQSLRGTHELDYWFGYPPLVNDAIMTELVKNVSTRVVGNTQVTQLPPSMGSDDMAFFLKEVPGCYFWVGAGNEQKGLIKPHHSSRFDFDEEALLVGAEIMVRVVLAYFTKH